MSEKNKGNHYVINQPELSGAVARLVELIKTDGAGFGAARFTCHDGSTVHIVLRDKPSKRLAKQRARRAEKQAPTGAEVE